MNATAWYEELKSGPGWSRLLGERATKLVVTGLVIALALDSALILTRALSQSALPPPATAAPRAAPFRAAANPTLELATVVNAHLFGLSGTQSGGAAPQTTMPLILAGVIADKDPAKGQAIIGDTAAAAKLYAVGAMIPGGARLNSVYGDRVLIERNGRLETLMLPRTSGKGAAPPSLPPAAAQSSPLRDNATVLAGLVRVQSVYNQGKLSGYRIFPGGAHGASTFNQLGLRAGDLIVAVNGTPLDDAARAMEVLQTLSSSATATVTVSRNNQNQEVNLNLANLSTDLESTGNENAAGTGGTEQPQGAAAGAQMRGPRLGSANPPAQLTTAPSGAPTGAGAPTAAPAPPEPAAGGSPTAASGGSER